MAVRIVAMKAEVEGDQTVNGIDYEHGHVLFATPGFSGTNGLPTITCTDKYRSRGSRHWSPDTSLRASTTQGR